MMKKLAIPLSLAIVATLSACAASSERTVVSDSTGRDVRGEKIVTSNSIHPGFGKVVVLVDPTGPINGISTQRMTLKMDNGSIQVIDQRGPQIAMGEYIQIRQDNTIVRY